MGDLIPNDYATLLAEVKERIRSAQYAALRAVNKELIALFLIFQRLFRASGFEAETAEAPSIRVPRIEVQTGSTLQMLVQR